MRAITVLAMPIYQSLSSNQHLNLTERREATRQYMLNEIVQWKIKTLKQGSNYYFKPVEFVGDQSSAPFEVRLVSTPFGYHDLKFGNINAPTDEERFEWVEKDPYKLPKAMFLIRVLENKVVPLLRDNKIKGVMFSPYNEDGLGDDRYSYFYNMFSKLNNNNEFSLKKEGEFYYINKNK